MIRSSWSTLKEEHKEQQSFKIVKSLVALGNAFWSV